MMILRRGIFAYIRVKYCSCRSITVSSIQLNKDRRKNLPSRKIFDELTERGFIDEQLTRSGRRTFEIMVEKPIVVKSFFISDVDAEDIQYPKVTSTDALEHWKKTNAQISDYFTKNIEYNDTGFSPSVYEKFKVLDLFGYSVPKSFGGQELSHTERIFASETESQDIAAAMALNSHRSVCAIITEIGSNEQCSRFLPKLAKADLIGTIAFEEWNPIDKVDLNTRAEYDDDEDQWCLNGTKSFVVNAADANLFLVIAETAISDRKGDKKNAFTVFVVDGALPGVKVHSKDTTIGHRNLFQASVTFEDVILSNDAVLSIPGTGDYVQQRVQIHSRLNHGLMNLTQMKSILQYMMSMADSIEQVTVAGNQNNEAKTLRAVVGKYACSIYALESMLYMTTGIMDQYNNTNIDLETAICKTYSQDQLLNMTTDLLSFVDARVTLDQHPLNQFIRNAVQLKFGEPTNDLKIHIGTVGIHHRLNRLIEEIHFKKNKKFVIKNFMTEEQLDMYEPELRPAAKALFDSIVLLRLGASTLIEREARDIPKRHIEIKKLADAAACIYASFACLLRGDQSLKMKLPNGKEEIAIAQTVCDKNIAEVQLLMEYIEDGPTKTFVTYHEYMTHLLLQKDLNFPAHPLTRFF